MKSKDLLQKTNYQLHFMVTNPPAMLYDLLAYYTHVHSFLCTVSHCPLLSLHVLPFSSHTSSRSVLTTIGARDHSVLKEYKVFINPSLSEVLCTTIVEVTNQYASIRLTLSS